VECTEPLGLDAIAELATRDDVLAAIPLLR
jgi:hypothetical protein